MSSYSNIKYFLMLYTQNISFLSGPKRSVNLLATRQEKNNSTIAISLPLREILCFSFPFRPNLFLNGPKKVEFNQYYLELAKGVSSRVIAAELQSELLSLMTFVSPSAASIWL